MIGFPFWEISAHPYVATPSCLSRDWLSRFLQLLIHSSYQPLILRCGHVWSIFSLWRRYEFPNLVTRDIRSSTMHALCPTSVNHAYSSAVWIPCMHCAHNHVHRGYIMHESASSINKPCRPTLYITILSCEWSVRWNVNVQTFDWIIWKLRVLGKASSASSGWTMELTETILCGKFILIFNMWVLTASVSSY